MIDNNEITDENLQLWSLGDERYHGVINSVERITITIKNALLGKQTTVSKLSSDGIDVILPSSVCEKSASDGLLEQTSIDTISWLIARQFRIPISLAYSHKHSDYGHVYTVKLIKTPYIHNQETHKHA